jgi:hypothetical protein
MRLKATFIDAEVERDRILWDGRHEKTVRREPLLDRQMICGRIFRLELLE